MSNVTYSAGNLTITVAGLDTVEQALGDLKRKTPAAAKVAINATARQARKLMVAKAKTRYAVNAAGRRHLKDLVQRKKASNSSLLAELHVASMRNDLGYFKTSPAVPTHFTGMDFKDGPSVWKAKVLKSSGMKTLPGAGGMSKGFLVKFSSGHVGMVQRRIGSKSSHTRTAKGYKPQPEQDGGGTPDGGGQVIFAPQITVQGNADRAVLESVLDDAQQRFEMWYEQMMRRKARTAY